MEKLFNIYGKKVNKGETHAFLYADLNMEDSGVVCEHGSAYFYFRITRTVCPCLLACVQAYFFLPSFRLRGVCIAAMLRLDNGIYADRV